MNELHQKNRLLSVILWILIVATVGTAFLFAHDMNRLNKAFEDIMQVEAISSTTQRQISLSENNEHQQREIFNISALTEKALTANQDGGISLMSEPDIAVLATRVLDEWNKIEGILTVNWNLEEGEETKDLDYISLRLARDTHFSAMTDLSDGIGDYTQDLGNQISQYQVTIMFLLLFIGLIVFSNALKTNAQLRISKELAEKSQIDTATGLYNRSRCQELFKANQTMSDKRKPAIMVLDLNDLKKTNDKLGHRVGDELISSFASILKKATNIHNTAPFIGRYGGDEFIVFYEDVKNEEELQIYMKELEFLTKEHNENETRFQVSYALGYSLVTENSNDDLTVRQLFDQADEAMYVNKIEVKRAKNEENDVGTAKGETK